MGKPLTSNLHCDDKGRVAATNEHSVPTVTRHVTNAALRWGGTSLTRQLPLFPMRVFAIGIGRPNEGQERHCGYSHRSFDMITTMAQTIALVRIGRKRASTAGYKIKFVRGQAAMFQILDISRHYVAPSGFTRLRVNKYKHAAHHNM